MKYNSKELKKIFYLFDKDSKGYITSNDYYKTIETVDDKYSLKEIQKMFEITIPEYNGKLDFETFTKLMNNELSIISDEKRLKKILQTFDRNSNNKINLVEMKHLMLKLCKILNQKEIEEFLKLESSGLNGYIDIDELANKLLN